VDGGYVFLHRRILDSDLWCLRSHQIIIAEICLLKAVWKDCVVRGVPLNRGQWLTHYSTIHELCPKGVSIRQVRRAIETLSDSKVGFLDTQVVTRFGRRWLLLTVNNYEGYQAPGLITGTGVSTRSGTQGADEGQSGGTTIKEEVKEVEEVKKERIASVAFQDHWNSHPSLQHVRTMTKDRRARLNRRAAYKDFCDHWQEAVTALSQSPFHTGQNERGWRADVDWFLRNDTNWAKALERKDTVEIRGRKSREEIERIEAARLKEAEDKYGEVDPDKLPPFLREKFKEKVEAADVSHIKGRTRKEDEL